MYARAPVQLDITSRREVFNHLNHNWHCDHIRYSTLCCLDYCLLSFYLEYDSKLFAMSWFRRQFLKSSRLAKSASSPHSRQYTMASHDASILRDCNVEQFYKYTPGRWLWNEEYQLARRYVECNYKVSSKSQRKPSELVLASRLRNCLKEISVRSY